MANTSKSSPARFNMSHDHLFDSGTEVKVRVSDDTSAGSQQGVHRIDIFSDANHILGFSDWAKPLGAAFAIVSAALHEHGPADLVARQKVLSELTGFLGQPRAIPQMVVRVNDGAAWIEDRLPAQGQPFRIDLQVPGERGGGRGHKNLTVKIKFKV